MRYRPVDTSELVSIGTPAVEPLLRVDGLRTVFRTHEGPAVAVDDVSFELAHGETLAIVGESGSGKTVLSLSLLRLVTDPPGRVVGGHVWYGGRDLLALDEHELEGIRGNEISMIFQEPMASLNPVLTIGRQLTEGIIAHRGMSPRQAWEHSVAMLRLVGISEPEKRMRQYPHQISGGMMQRVVIAMALSCEPKILIADEPTTALDVTVQAQILDLMRELQRRLHMAIILVTHNMGVVAEMADRVIVMYAGRKVEEGRVNAIFENQRHPYSRGLLQALPRLGVLQSDGRPQRLSDIPGIVPPLTRLPRGCYFAPRCAFAVDRCRKEYPPLEEKLRGHWAACWESHRLETAANG